MIALGASAQTGGSGQPSGKRHGLPNHNAGARATDPGSPIFLPVVTYDSGGLYARSVAVADVNGDGKPDVLVSNFASSNTGVLLGNGDGTFIPVVTLPGAGAVAVADLNRDGKPDLLLASGGNVAVLLGNGDGTFQAAVTYDSGGQGEGERSIAVADVNGDGNPDLVVSHDSLGGPQEDLIGVLLGNGDGTFQKAVSYGSGGWRSWSVAVADVNADGKLDLLVANFCSPSGCVGDGVVGVLLGNGNGTFKTAVTYDSGGILATSIAVGDVNGDNKPDLLVANGCDSNGDCNNGTVAVLLGKGNGTFQTAAAYGSGGYNPVSVAVADVNGDGKPDVMLANQCQTTPQGTCPSGLVGVLLGNGDGTFQPVVTYESGGSLAYSLVVADVNGDGLLDMLVANAGSGDGSVGVLLNNTGPHTPTTTTLVSSANPANRFQIVTYTASVTTQSGETAMGTVTFQDGGVTIATVTLVGNQAAYSTKYTKIGVHLITATYSGDLHNAGSTSATLTEDVRGASKTVVVTSGSPSYVGQAVTFTATVTSSQGAIPDGELVTFYDGTTAIGMGATSNSVAKLTTSSLTAKTHTIKAAYPGDATFRPSSGTVTQVVNKYPTTTTLTSSPNPSQFGQAVTFTAHVTSSGPAPTGKVKFLDGTLAIGSATLSGGVAKLTKSNLAVGTHPITAHYNGDAASATSTSAVVNQVVQ
jgi:hypothetical protein